MVFSDFWPDDPFRRYSPSKSKVVKNCAEFWTFFSPCQILGGGPSENCKRVITPALRHVDWKKFHEDTPTRSGVIVAHTLNFRSNFKFSRLKFFRGTPVPVGVCARLLWSTSRVCKKFQDAAPPEGQNVVSRKMSTWVGQYEPLSLCCLWTKVHQFFLAQRGRGCSW